MTKYEDVKNVTTEEYFNNNKFSIDVFHKKYAKNENETYPQALKRVCDFVASVERTDELKKYWSERWFDEIYNDWWHPAGSIMQGADSEYTISLSNCTTVSMGVANPEQEWDNLESIFKNGMYTIAKSAALRQGLGTDVSRLRPRNSKIYNSSKISSGVIHWMKAIDSIGYLVGQHGRVPAMLISLNIRHPEVIDFIKVKSDFTVIQNANISVQITENFYTACERDEMWEMIFEIPEVKKGQKVYIDVHSITKDSLKDEKGWYYISKKNRPYEKITNTARALDILELIAKGMQNYAEPGIQNIDIARKYSNSDYVYDPTHECDSRILSTNACSEQYLSRDSVCIISSINVGRFSIDPIIFREELKKIGYSINRFLDNVNECELVYHTYATPHQRLAIESLRRTGAGSTNWEAWFLKQNVIYGSPEANKVAEEFNKTYNYYLYESSISLGKEKGNFGLFNRKKLEKSPFIKHMMELGLEFTHLRNITVSSIAPTGTLSLMNRGLVMSYGVEPSFGLFYWKRTRISGKYEYYFNVPGVVRDIFREKGYEIPIGSETIKDTWDGKYGKPVAEFIMNNLENVGITYKDSTFVDPLEKLEFMSALMKDCDSSISTTYLLPENSDYKDIMNFILLSHKKEVKSIAAFPDRKMYGIVSFIAFKDLAKKLLSEGVQIHEQNFTEDELKELSEFALVKKESITDVTNAPKRPKVLPADVYSITVKGEKFIVAVGLLNNKPYEVFAGKMNGFNLKKREYSGNIIKVKRGIYSLEIGEITFDNFNAHFEPVEAAIFRMVSTALRHGTPVKFIVEQLNKTSDDIGSLVAASSRVLKKYIVEGEKVTGLSCPSCGNTELQYDATGCVECVKCGWSKCN